MWQTEFHTHTKTDKVMVMHILSSCTVHTSFISNYCIKLRLCTATCCGYLLLSSPGSYNIIKVQAAYQLLGNGKHIYIRIIQQLYIVNVYITRRSCPTQGCRVNGRRRRWKKRKKKYIYIMLIIYMFIIYWHKISCLCLHNIIVLWWWLQ